MAVVLADGFVPVEVSDIPFGPILPGSGSKRTLLCFDVRECTESQAALLPTSFEIDGQAGTLVRYTALLGATSIVIDRWLWDEWACQSIFEGAVQYDGGSYQEALPRGFTYATFANVNQTTPLTATTASSNSGQTLTAGPLTVTDGDYAFAILGHASANRSFTWTSGWTEFADREISGARMAGARQNVFFGSLSVTATKDLANTANSLLFYAVMQQDDPGPVITNVPNTSVGATGIVVTGSGFGT